MDREEDKRRFWRIDIAGLIAAQVINFSMVHPEKRVAPADFFEAPKKPRVDRRKCADRFERNMKVLGGIHGLIVRDRDGNLLRTEGPVKPEELKPGEKLTPE